MIAKRFAVSLATLGFCALLAAPASAAYIEDGLVFKIFNDGLAPVDLVGGGDNPNDTYKFRVTLDTAGYTGDDDDYIWAISIKNTSSYDAASHPSETAPGVWTFVPGGLNNGGCNGSGAGFLCSQAPDKLSVLSGATYEWVFYIDQGADFFTPPHLKANWFDPDGGKEGQISVNVEYETTGVGSDVTSEDGDVSSDVSSENPTDETPTTSRTSEDIPVPEPGSLLLLGTGLAAAASRLRRRKE